MAKSETGARKTSRAGRNLPAAIAVGAFLGFSLIAILLFAPYVWLPVVAVAVALATHEVIRRLRTAGYAIPVWPLLIGGQAAPGSDVAGPAAPGNYLRDISATVFLAAWVPLFASFGALLIYPDDGAGRVFCLMLGVVFSDIGGYTAGVLFGKHPMAPAISPKKSWEGLAGSLLLGITASVLAVNFLLHKPAWVGVPLGLMLVITGTLGDLVESQVKRDLGIKDMGTLLPGHGGLMDRLDSLLPNAFMAWLLLSVFLGT